MEVGLQKLHENEWLVHIGCAKIKMDRFSVALLKIHLEHLIASEKGQSHSTLQGYVSLGLRMKKLSDLHLQKLLREIRNEDLLILMQCATDPELNQKVLKNIGGLMSKQLETDLLTHTELPLEPAARTAIRRIVEVTFKLESQGEIEFLNDVVRYI